MIFYKNIEDILEKDLINLKENSVEESTILEFKENINLQTSDDKNEFLKDVVAMANAKGGLIIYGGKQSEDGKLIDFLNIDYSNFDELIRQMESLIVDRIKPRLIGFNIKKFNVDNNNILLIKIKGSFQKPHSFICNHYPRFPIRQNRSINFMDVDELRVAFDESNSLSKNIDLFVFERLIKIKDHSAPVELVYNKPFLIVHLFSYDFLDNSKKIDFDKIKSLPELNISEFIFNYFFNFDGVVGDVITNSKKSLAYVQVFNNGTIEYVDQRFFSDNNEIYLEDFIKYLEKNINNFLKILHSVDCNAPYFIKMSIQNIKGYRIKLPPNYFTVESRQINNDELNFNQIKIEKKEDLYYFLNLSINRLCNAGGISKCPIELKK